MEYLIKSTTSVRRTCNSLERKVTQVQNDFLLYKDLNRKKQSTDFKLSLDYTSEHIETLEREKADLTRKVNGLKKDLEEQIDNIEQYSRRQCLVFMGIEEEREENTDQVILEFCRDNLGITIFESQLDRSHRLGPSTFDDKGKKVNRPIILQNSIVIEQESWYFLTKKLEEKWFCDLRNSYKKKNGIIIHASKENCWC